MCSQQSGKTHTHDPIDLARPLSPVLAGSWLDQYVSLIYWALVAAAAAAAVPMLRGREEGFFFLPTISETGREWRIDPAAGARDAPRSSGRPRCWAKKGNNGQLGCLVHARALVFVEMHRRSLPDNFISLRLSRYLVGCRSKIDPSVRLSFQS